LLHCLLGIALLGSPATAGAEPQDSAGPTQAAGRAPIDHCTPSAQVPEGNVSVSVADAQGRPVSRAPVALLAVSPTEPFESARVEQHAMTGPDGRVLLAVPPSEKGAHHQVSVRHEAVEYRCTPFTMRPGLGQEVLLHVFPVTRHLAEAQVTLRALVYLAVHEELIHFDILLQTFNPSRVAAISEDLAVGLPRGAQGFASQKTSTQLRLVLSRPEELKLQGGITPGQHELTFSFDVPTPGEQTASFDLSLPRRTTEAHVATIANSSLRLAVAGFPPAERKTTVHGQRLLVTARSTPTASTPVSPVVITLTGLPSPSEVRYLVLVVALLLASGGIAVAYWNRSRRATSSEQIAEQRQAARELLLAELVALHHAHQRAEVGPRAFTNARSALIDAIARLELEENGRSTGQYTDSSGV
jgi:hypothetical protein